MTLPTTTLATRQLQIEFLFLDLDSCTRCRATDATLQEAIERTRPALDAAGVTVAMSKTLVASQAQARQLGFVSSPTIRINGVDIAGELVESACDSCSEACACNGGVDCRDWIYQGERSTQPPLGLIVEAIMRHAVGTDLHNPTSARPQPPVVPDNLRQYFAAAAAPVADTPTSECCAAEVQAGCCQPEDKTGCCGAGAAMASSSCGCHAGP
jgi:glutaredoxin